MLPAAVPDAAARRFLARCPAAAAGRAEALLTGHLLVRPTTPSTPARVGFVVSRAVGIAVVRNRVRRRLRRPGAPVPGIASGR